MKNSELFPLTRNRYFSGKQLVTRDMIAEQRYFNNKRRLLNSTLYGWGIVCGLGLTVLEQGDKAQGGQAEGVSVVVEPGLAIDGRGREIVVPEQVYLRLSDLDGFASGSGDSRYVYLCVEYDELDYEPMHSIVDSALHENHFNRVEEKARFYLTHNEPRQKEAADSEAGFGQPENRHFMESLESLLEKGEGQVICLGRIELVRWEQAYSITGLETAAYRRHIISPASGAANVGSLHKTAGNEDVADKQEHCCFKDKEDTQLRQGRSSVNIPEESKGGTVFYSEEIFHGLGAGSVFISAGIDMGGAVVWGSGSIFGGGEFEYAVKSDESKGSFQIGVRLNKNFSGSVNFSWSALKSLSGVENGQAQPYLLISPGTGRIKVRETIQFSCEIHGAVHGGLAWRVCDEEGGSINGQGFYRGPNIPGVYEIEVSGAEQPELRASAFVVVVEE